MTDLNLTDKVLQEVVEKKSTMGIWNKLEGLSALNSLKILDLSDNQINSFVVHQGFKPLSKLEVLALDVNMINGSMLRKSLKAFTSIRVLSLSENEFIGTIVAEDFRDLSCLEHLTLENSKIENVFFESIGELTSLKVLTLSGCEINGTLPDAGWSKLKKLEELDLGENEFEGPLPSSFVNMTSLRRLELSYNHFTGNFDSNLASFTSLEYFGFIENQFDVPVSFKPFANHSKLKFIYGEGNRVILDSHPSLQTWIPKFQLQVLSLSSTTVTNFLPLPHFLRYQYNLTSLDLTSCKLEGEFPNWLLENNTKISEFLVRNCSFTNTFQLPSHPLPNMRRIDVSDNAITGHIPSNNISSIFPNLQFLNMSINNIQGSIPHDFGQMNLLDTLDLSDNHLSGEMQNISGDKSLLNFLKLSNNKLDGSLFPTLSNLKHLEQLYLDGNSLSGSIPSSFPNASLLALDLSNNHLGGKLPRVIGNSSNLVALSLSNNHLEGSIPTQFVELQSLVYLDMSDNSFTGSVPSFANASARFIHLNNNRLSSLSKRMFGESSSLWILDLRYNEINANIHNMIQDLSYSGVSILLLKGNLFLGKISKQICQLIDLTILDLSHNNLSGPIPSCLGKMHFENENPVQSQMIFGGFYDRGKNSLPYVQEKVNFTTKERSYNYTGEILSFMSGIDLSYNKLSGNIPPALGNLTKIRAMNLSHNYLTGKIPATFSHLVQTESLDLSFNILSGQIPSQLSDLTSLAIFSVAHNNLSGETPERKGQFITFDERSYEGNPFLCGPPLPKSCYPNEQPPVILPNDSSVDGDKGGLVDRYVFCISFGASYASILLVIAMTLYMNPYWRQAWFYCMELVITNCHYFLEDNLCKFTNFKNT
ncbi:receptor-like protein 15 [Abrus precatorius]|uniref:Receptor-like protein 15 n=1 Tax=Abrus precatorius TaxID=3816 RepID=A0A8B8K4P8_ABRPR|nr:receptor-like protein 15 [Abrus precatorius]